MSRISGEKARANIARKNRTARRASDRARLAELKAAAPQPKPEPKPKKVRAQKPEEVLEALAAEVKPKAKKAKPAKA